MEIKFIHNGLETIAIAKYHNKTYKAKAKCSAEDDYYDEVGEDLAENRLMIKIAKARQKDLSNKLVQAQVGKMFFEHEVESLTEAYNKACKDESMFSDVERHIIEIVEQGL